MRLRLWTLLLLVKRATLPAFRLATVSQLAVALSCPHEYIRLAIVAGVGAASVISYSWASKRPESQPKWTAEWSNHPTWRRPLGS